MTNPVRIVVSILSTTLIFLIGIAMMGVILPEVADGPFAPVAYAIVGVYEILPKLVVGGTIAAVAFILAVLGGLGVAADGEFMSDDPLRQFMFFVGYGTFAAAGFVYVLSMGAIGLDMMIEAAFLPTWLPLVDQPLLLALLFVGLGYLGLNGSA